MKYDGARILPVVGVDADDNDEEDENEEYENDEDTDDESADEEDEDDEGLTSDGIGFTSDEGDFVSYDNEDDVAGPGLVVAGGQTGLEGSVGQTGLGGSVGQTGLGGRVGQTGLGGSVSQTGLDKPDQLVAYLVTDADNPDIQFLVPATALPANYKPNVP